MIRSSLRKYDTLTPNEREAIRLVGVYTAGRFDTWTLSGSVKASCRAHIMSALQGKRVPQSKSGMTAMNEALQAIAQIPSDCRAYREATFTTWARESKIYQCSPAPVDWKSRAAGEREDN